MNCSNTLHLKLRNYTGFPVVSGAEVYTNDNDAKIITVIIVCAKNILAN
jgi:hypothetical protein